MNIKCELECDQDAKIYCHDCTKIHFYCQECFLLAHKASNKQNHKTTEEFPKSITEFQITCPRHPKDVKKVACLTCNKPVCGECIASGIHNSHLFGDFKSGFSKVAQEHKELIESCKNLQKKQDKSVSFLLEDVIKNLKGTQNYLKQSFAKFKKDLESKEKELVEIVNKEIEVRTKSKQELGGVEGKLKTATEECVSLVSKGCVYGAQDYDYLLQKTAELTQIKENLEAMESLKEHELINYPYPSFVHLIKALSELTLTKEVNPEHIEIKKDIKKDIPRPVSALDIKQKPLVKPEIAEKNHKSQPESSIDKLKNSKSEPKTEFKRKSADQVPQKIPQKIQTEFKKIAEQPHFSREHSVSIASYSTVEKDSKPKSQPHSPQLDKKANAALEKKLNQTMIKPEELHIDEVKENAELFNSCNKYILSEEKMQNYAYKKFVENDTEHVGAISLGKLMKIYGPIFCKKGLPSPTRAKVEQVAKKHDKDASGLFSLSEFKQILLELFWASREELIKQYAEKKGKSWILSKGIINDQKIMMNIIECLKKITELDAALDKVINKFPNSKQDALTIEEGVKVITWTFDLFKLSVPTQADILEVLADMGRSVKTFTKADLHYVACGLLNVMKNMGKY